MKYAAINIGPIVGTISMARKPRELWSASYLFSFLMGCIINELGNRYKKILSPASIEGVDNLFKKVGLYPDRVFVEDIDDDEVKDVVNRAIAEFSGVTGVGENYVNIMYVSTESADGAGVIKKLNYLLDCAELVNRPSDNADRVKVLTLIQEKAKSVLFEHAMGDPKWKIPTLSKIATYSLSKSERKEDWAYCIDALVRENEEDKGEEEFYKRIKSTFKKEYRSYYKYICVVQADGDKMGSIVSSLEKEDVKKLSSSLLAYGSAASRMIENYGGLPIYAGGDDLLFIAPVVSGGNNIFNLIAEIDTCYRTMVDDVMLDDVKTNENKGIVRPTDEHGKGIHTSLSYGLSISYYKYPLYEALNTARELLFGKAKNVTGKNAIAWCLRKHSGSGLTGSFTKSSLEGSVYQIFNTLMNYSVDDNLISAISYKLRANDGLLDILRNKEENRIEAFYLKIMEENNLGDGAYIGVTRALLCSLLRSYKEKKGIEMKDIISEMYGMLRTAKFINGEGDNNE